MIKGIQEVNFLKFLGLRNFEKANRVGKDFLYDCANSRFEGGVWKSKPGNTTFGDLLSGGTEDKGLMNYEYHTGTEETERVVRYYNGTFYYVVGTTWTAITTSWSDDSEVKGENFDNKLYIVNSVEGFGKLDDTAFSSVDATIKGTMIAGWASKIWVSGDKSAADIVRGSKSATVAHPEYVEEFDYVGDNAVALKMEAPVTGIIKWQDKLYIFMKKGIKIVTGFNDFGTYAQAMVVDHPLSTMGSINPNCVVAVENDVWYLTPEIKVRSLGESANYSTVRTKDLSWIIESIREELSPVQDKAVMYYDGQRVYLSLATKDSSDNNIVLVYDHINRTWSIDRYWSVKQLVQANGETYFSVSGSAQIYQDNSGLSNSGDDIAWWGQTALVDDSRPDMDKRARYLYIRGKKPRGLALPVRLYRDNYDTYSDYTIEAETPSATPSTLEVTTFASDAFAEFPFAGDLTEAESDNEVFDKYISLNQTGRMFGVYVGKLLNGQQIEIDQMILSYVPLRAKHTYN